MHPIQRLVRETISSNETPIVDWSFGTKTAFQTKLISGSITYFKLILGSINTRLDLGLSLTV